MKKVSKMAKINSKNGNYKNFIEQFEGEDLGKFQSVEQLINAYFELEKAYTKKCQALAELKNSTNSSLDATKNLSDDICLPCDDLEIEIDCLTSNSVPIDPINNESDFVMNDDSYLSLVESKNPDLVEDKNSDLAEGKNPDLAEGKNSDLVEDKNSDLVEGKNFSNEDFAHNNVGADCCPSFENIKDFKSYGTIAVRDA